MIKYKWQICFILPVESEQMEELFDMGQKGPERTDVNLWIFPHLKEFLVIDLRSETPRVTLLNTDDVFDAAVFNKIEEGFSQILREQSDYPFAHLMDLPLRVEELVRETGMLSILDKLGQKGSGEEFPTVGVFVVSGAALTIDPEQIGHALRSVLGDEADPEVVVETSNLLKRLLAEESQVVKRIDRHELREAVEDQSPMFLTLWQRRN